MSKEKKLLLTPGPTVVPEEVLNTQNLPMIHHRTAEYQELCAKVNQNLKAVFRTKDDVVVLSSSGTGAMEASVVNLFSKGDKIIAAYAGKFGERFSEIAKAYDLNVVDLIIESGSPIEAKDIARCLEQHPDAKGVLTTLLETSTGVLHPIKEIAAVTKKTDALLVVDAISGLLCDSLEMDDWGVDVVVGGSQKGFMLPPGLGFVALGERAQSRLSQSDLPKYYFNLEKAIKACKKNDTPFTPAISLVRGLDKTLNLVLTEGLEANWKRHERIAASTRERILSIGLTVFSKRTSNALTAIQMPDGIKSGDLIKAMRDDDDVIMADGQAELKGKIVRFAHMGATATDECATKGFKALENALAKLGYKACIN